jgi:hypothetical protein
MKRRSLTPQSAFDLIETFPQPGCAICNLLLQVTERILRNILLERLMDDRTHADLRARRGLCSTHSFQITQARGNAATLAMLYRTAADEVAHLLDALPDELPRGRKSGLFGSHETSLGDSLAPQKPCIACALIEDREQEYIDVMVTQLNEPALCAAYERSQGLCLPHLTAVIDACHDPVIYKLLLRVQRRLWTELRDDLDQFLHKMSYRFDYADKGHESNSWMRAMKQLSGDDRLFGVDPRLRLKPD